MWQTGENLLYEKYTNYKEIGEAIADSKALVDDGIIFGYNIGAGASPLAAIGLLNFLGDYKSTFGWFDFNECFITYHRFRNRQVYWTYRVQE